MDYMIINNFPGSEFHEDLCKMPTRWAGLESHTYAGLESGLVICNSVALSKGIIH